MFHCIPAGTGLCEPRQKGDLELGKEKKGEVMMFGRNDVIGSLLGLWGVYPPKPLLIAAYFWGI